MALRTVKRPHRFAIGIGGILLLVCATGILGWQARQQAQSHRALLDAIRHNDLVSVKSALARGADVNANNEASLWELLRSRLRVLLPLPDQARQEPFSTPLMLAIGRHDNADIIVALLQQGADTQMRNISGETALHLAAKNSDLPVMMALLKYHADVNAQDAQGDTPLMKAAEEEGSDGVQTLLEHRAQADLKNKKGENALDKARQTENIQAMLALQQTENVR